MTRHDLEKMTVIKLREEALKYSELSGVHGMKKSELVDALAKLMGLPEEETSKKKAKGKTIIYGHDPKYYDKIVNRIENRKKKIPLDNGCVYNRKHKIYDYLQLRKLCCFNLDTYELICQENVE